MLNHKFYWLDHLMHKHKVNHRFLNTKFDHLPNLPLYMDMLHLLLQFNGINYQHQYRNLLYLYKHHQQVGMHMELYNLLHRLIQQLLLNTKGSQVLYFMNNLYKMRNTQFYLIHYYNKLDRQHLIRLYNYMSQGLLKRSYSMRMLNHIHCHS
jgi:hypothetical protein